MKSLPQSDLRDFGLLYRQAAADLSAARTDKASRTLENYLNALVGRAHNYIYSGQRVSPVSLWRFFAHGYPRLLRRLSGYVVLATTLFVVAGLFASLMVIVRPAIGAEFLGPAMMNKIEHHQMWTESVLTAKPQSSSAIMTNNISVCFMTFAGGILAGLGSVFLLLTNGLEIGVVSTVCAQHGMALSLWSFVAAHGALELPSIMLAGAAGLRLGSGILFPGMLRRRESIALAGSEAVQLVSATIPLLIVAGSFEAFLSPTHIPIALKFATCAVLFTGLCWWFGEGGRQTVDSRV